jgi:hypothetical protein
MGLYKNHGRHPIARLVEMMYSRGFIVYCFDPDDDASILHGTILSRTGVRQVDPLRPLMFNLAISTPSGILGNGARILRQSTPSLAMKSV